MRLHLLGTAAGGGIPQWNCTCSNCQAARTHPSLTRSQSQLAVSTNGDGWLLVNASPDLREQLYRTPFLHPHPEHGPRSTPVAGVLLTSADLDHILGLLLIREFTPVSIYASPSVSLTVDPEPATLTVLATQASYNLLAPPVTVAPGATIPYGSYLAFNVQVVGSKATGEVLDGVATGTVKILDNGAQIAEVPLNATSAIYYMITTLDLGSHSLTFSYAGDSSYQAVTSSPFNLTVSKGATQIDYTQYLVPVNGGGGYLLLFEVGSSNMTSFGGGLPPTGTLTVQLGTQTQNLTLLPESNGTSTAIATFNNLQPGNYSLLLTYPGDQRWGPAKESGEYPASVSTPNLPITTTTLALVSPAASSEPFVSGTQVTMSVQIAGNGSTAPTGDLVANINGLAVPILYPIVPGTGNISTAAVVFPAYDGYTGTNDVVVWYFGDGKNAGSISNIVSYTAKVDDFTLQVSKPNLMVVSGQAASVDILLNSFAFGVSTSTINLTCTVTGGPSGNTILPTCTVPRSATLTGTGQVTASMNLATSQVSTADLQKPRDPSSGWNCMAGPVTLAFMLMWFPARRRKLSITLLVLIGMSSLGLVSACSGGPKAPPATTTTSVNAPAGAYHVVVTATNGTTTHSVPVQLVITGQ